MNVFKNILMASFRLIQYNLKIIFANKFIYFLIAALFIFVLVTVLNIVNANTHPTEASVFWLLLVPGILLIFYPITFGIQNDVDNRMIEILFGIPNYRYKVWLLRLMLIFVMTFAILLVLSALSSLALTVIPIIDMVAQLMAPVIFLGSAAFMVSTVVKNGSGTAVVMVVAGVIIWIARPFFSNHRKWDVFLNPYDMPNAMNETVWRDIIVNNRIFLVTGTLLALLYGLMNLQKREKFLQ